MKAPILFRPWYVILLVLLFACQQKETASTDIVAPYDPTDYYYPETNCLLTYAKRFKLKELIVNGGSKPEVIAMARSFVADSIKQRYDTLWADVAFEFVSSHKSTSIRVNGYTVRDNAGRIPIFGDSLCLWIQGRETQGKLAGEIVINNRRAPFEFDPYDNMSIKTQTYILKKDFNLLRPLVKDTSSRAVAKTEE